MSHSWLSYLPSHLAADLLAHSESSPLDRVLRGQAVALFADISGFTPMSEALGQVGPKGTEELSQILNRIFGPMIDRIQAYGGSVGKIAGDALLALFPCTPRTRRRTLRRAVQCALDIQDQLQVSATVTTSAGTFPLAMKVGIGLGNVLTTTVGDPQIRLEYLLAGSAIDACAEAEHHAPKGAVVLADTLLPFAGLLDHQPVAEGYRQVLRLHRRPRSPLPTLLPVAPPSLVATIARYLPLTIVERLEAGQHGFVDEHRLLTVLFVRFAGFTSWEGTVVPSVQAYFATVVRCIDRYGGYLRQVEVGDKGSLFIVLFGTPVAHEDDAERALLCALELREQTSQPLAIGIASGWVFCGLIGSEHRREYAAVGDTVNLAARLMSAAAWGEILVAEGTRQLLPRLFWWEERPPLTVKGKQHPVLVALLRKRRQRSPRRLRAPGYTLPMVGRQQELAVAQHCVAQVVKGWGQLLLISAEAGMGKSRLVAELLRYVAQQPITYYASECLSYSQQPYLVWQHLLRALFGLTPSLPEDEQIVQVQKILQGFDLRLLERAPLLSPLLNLPIPETVLSRSLEGRVRQEALYGLLLDCLQHWTRTRPLLLVLEDCHWIDELSWELLLTIAQRGSGLPLLLLLTYRPLEYTSNRLQAALEQLSRLSHAYMLRLSEFNSVETEELIALKLAQRFAMQDRIPPRLLQRISAQAQGNPFYIDELLNLMHARGIDVRDPAALEGMELPQSLQRLILSRIDQLEEGSKTTLKVASIIGRLFSADWVWHIHPVLRDAGQVYKQLALLQERDFMQLERSEPEVDYLFKHILTREVAYESLALSTRRELHEAVGAFIEAQYADTLDRYLDRLAYHYGHSANVAKQREYYERAGRAAKATFANTAAIRYFEQLLEVLPEVERGPTMVALAEILNLVGRRDESLEYTHRALLLAERLEDLSLLAQASRIQGDTLRNLGQYDAALAALEQAQASYIALQDQRGLAETLRVISGVFHSQGRSADVIAEGATWLELATATGAYAVSCIIINDIGVCFGEQEQLEQAIAYFERGIELARTHNLPVELALLMSNLGNALISRGAYPQAFAQCQQSFALALSIGYHTQVVISLISLGSLYVYVGQDAAAQRCFLAAQALMGELPDPRWLGFVLVSLAVILTDQDEAALAEQLYIRAIKVCRTFGVRHYLCWTLRYHAEFCLRQGRYAEAEHSNAEALALARELHVHSIEVQCRVHAIHLAVAQGRLLLPDALVQLEALRAEGLHPEQQAWLDEVIWQLDPQQEVARQAAVEQYRALYMHIPRASYRRQYAKLTSEWLPAPPILPDPPSIVDEHTIDIETLLQRVDRFLATQPS